MNTGGTALVGSATITAGDDKLTLTAHGLAEGTVIEFTSIAGGAIGLLTEDAEYYVRNPTVNDFQVSGSPGGAIIDFALGGAAGVNTAVPTYAGVDLRRINTAHLHPASTDRFGAREGVRPHSTAAVTLSGTTWTVNETLATVYPRETSTSAPYTVAVDLTSGSLTAADGSNPRLDAIDLQVQDDDEDGTGQRRARVIYTAGTPASSPSAPAAVNNAVRLATILVPATGTPAPSIASQAQYDKGPGILPVRTTAERPAAGLFESMYIDQWDTNLLYRYDGSAFVPVASKINYDYVTLLNGGAVVTGPETYTPVVSGQGTASFSTLIGRWRRVAPGLIWWHVFMIVSAAGSGTSVLQVTSPTNPDRTTRQSVQLTTTDGTVSPASRSGSVFTFQTGAGAVWDRFAWDNGGATNGLENMDGSKLTVGLKLLVQGTYWGA